MYVKKPKQIEYVMTFYLIVSLQQQKCKGRVYIKQFCYNYSRTEMLYNGKNGHKIGSLHYIKLYQEENMACINSLIENHSESRRMRTLRGDILALHMILFNRIFLSNLGLRVCYDKNKQLYNDIWLQSNLKMD